MEELRFGAFLQEISVQQDQISYNELVPPVQHDAEGRELPYRPPRLELRPLDVYNVLRPYVGSRLSEQAQAVIPLAAYLVLFQVVILRQPVSDLGVVLLGMLAVIVGLMMFMEGLKVGLMPFGETIGMVLPTKSSLPVVLLITLLLGVGVTFAEPAIGALKAAGAIVERGRAPLLHTLLNEWSGALVGVVGGGVGVAAVLGTLRFLYGWSLKPFIYATLVPTLALTGYMALDPQLSMTLGLAWDCGAVTTGPVTVPLVLALGIGIAAAAGQGGSSLAGFGVVTLASLFPVLGVLGLACFVSFSAGPDLAAAAASAAGEAPWYERSPLAEIVSGVRAIVPLVVFLLGVMRFVLRERMPRPGLIAYGISLTVLGMTVFNLGLSYGLAKLGGESGGLVPAAFARVEAVLSSPLYSFPIGLSIAGLFAFVLGFGATLAEPALNALGLTVENLTSGAFKKQLLMYAVSIGVATGIAVGVLKIVFAIPLAYLLFPGYGLALLLTALSSEEFVNVAWDSAGVTTGPVTVPLVLAMGLGCGNTVGAVEGFGILSMASVGPIVAVLATGLWLQWRAARRHRAVDEALEVGGVA